MSKVVHLSKCSLVRKQYFRMLSCTRSFAAASSSSFAIRALRLCKRWIVWKIEYYDRELKSGSPDPADESVTTRVLTVMLAEEY
jgi:hypothetical protein